MYLIHQIADCDYSIYPSKQFIVGFKIAVLQKYEL